MNLNAEKNDAIELMATAYIYTKKHQEYILLAFYEAVCSIIKLVAV